MIEKKDRRLKHSKKEKYPKIWRPNVQSYIASFLCIALLFTSLDHIPSMAAETLDAAQASAEEYPPVSGGDLEDPDASDNEHGEGSENPDASDNESGEGSENPDASDNENGEGSEDPDASSNEDGGTTGENKLPVVLCRFTPLSEEASHILLEMKGTLTDVLSQMPSVLTAYAEQENAEDSSLSEVEVELPVSWSCSEDYEGTEFSSYIFRPEWDESHYSYEGEADGIPTIEVTITPITDVIMAAAQEELVQAFAQKVPKIVLTEDIILSSTIFVPASTDTVLDGQGHSLYRDSGFTGTMLCLGSEGDEEEAYARLTLTDICVDGQIPGNRAGAPAIIDYGILILEANAIVRNNYNYGTYHTNDGSDVNDYGGGIQVYGELKVTENSLVTGNFADEFGGGVYLAPGATLWLYADVIRENTVADGSGYGADLFASKGSTVYYDPAVDMDREGFYYYSGETTLINMGEAQEPQDTLQTVQTPPVYKAPRAVDDKVEIFLNIGENSGYTSEQQEELVTRLQSLGYTVLQSEKTNIDTTDLRNWYVYDHYDTNPNCWGSAKENNIPTQWLEQYGDYLRRPFYSYECTSTYIYSTSNPVYTVADWLNSKNTYCSNGTWRLAHFKEHIYTREENGYPKMTFAGYGNYPYVDFLFYDPESDGEKEVNFDIDSSQLTTHTLYGSGFLINTGIDENQKIHGYLLLYIYKQNTTQAASLNLYSLDSMDIDVDTLHGSTGGNILSNLDTSDAYIQKINIGSWNNQMSIRIKATPTSITVWQQPKGETTGIEDSDPILSYTWDAESTYNGFGPLVAYASHGCDLASSFTYSNLRMSYINSLQIPGDMLNSLREADFTQDGTQKYFLNLFGSSDLEYNTDAGFNRYQGFLKMMQAEGIALITDRQTPFAEEGRDFLGDNLHELQGNGVGTLTSIDDLVGQIQEYLNDRTTTNIQDKLESGSLTEATPEFSVGNIWLKTVADNTQIREQLYGDSFTENGCAIQIMDNISYYASDDISVRYSILKPGSLDYTPLSVVDSPSGNVGTDPGTDSNSGDDTDPGTDSGSGDDTDPGTDSGSGDDTDPGTDSGSGDDTDPEENDNTVSGGDLSSAANEISTQVVSLPTYGAARDMRNAYLFTPPPFTISKDPAEWPAGRYTVRQSISNSPINGYAYFDLRWNNTQPIITPVDPTYAGENTETFDNDLTTASAQPVISENTGRREPKTGDASHVSIYATVAMIAGFSYLLLYFTDEERGMTEQKKKEIVDRLIRWAKKGKHFRRLIAITVIFFLLVYYHGIGKYTATSRRRLYK